MRWFVVLMLVALPLPSRAQETGSVQGVVRNAETGAPLAGANILVEGTRTGASANADGRFTIRGIAPGSYVLKASFVGFTDQRREVVVAAGEATWVELSLSPTPLRSPEVIVTAAQARERETPATFTDMSSQQLRDVHLLQDPPSVLSELPSVIHYSWEGNDIGYSFLNMRGFDQRRVAVMINGIPQNDPEDHNVYWVDMPDLMVYSNSIQVQRGAGSMFYGPPAIGGSVNIVTTPVSVSPRISVSSSFGFQEYGDRGETVLNTRRHALALHSGLVADRYHFFSRLSTLQSAGYRHDSWTNLHSYFLGAARYDRTMTTRLHIYGGPVEHGLAYYGIPKFYNNKSQRRTNYNFFVLDPSGQSVFFSTRRKPQERGTFSQPHYEVLHEWNLATNVAAHNTLFYIQGDGHFDYDGDWVWVIPPAADWLRKHVGYDTTQMPSMILRGSVANRQWGWLPRVEVKHGSGTLTIGGEMRIHRSKRWGTIAHAETYPPNFNPDFRFYEFEGEKDMLALYVHKIHRLNERTTLMANAQLAYNRYGYGNEKFIGTSFSVPYLFVNPRIGVNHNVTETLHGYLSLGYTSREPRLFNLYNGEQAWTGATPEFEATTANGVVRYDFDKPIAKPERLFNVELGGGYVDRSNRMTVHLYWMEFFDELIRNGTLDIFGRPITGNADRTRHTGVEIVAEREILEHIHFGGSLTLSRNRLIRFREFDASGAALVRDGNPIAGFPDVVGNARLTYRADRFHSSIRMKHVGAFHTDNSRSMAHKVDAHTVFDVDASYGFPVESVGELLVRTKIRNLFNTLYLAGGEGEQFFPGAERSYFISFEINL